MTRLLNALFAGVAMALMFGGPTFAAVTSYDPATVVAALQNAGYKAKLVTERGKDPKVESAAAGNDITVFFAGCSEGKECDQVEFLAFWNCADDLKRCKALHAKWNDDELFSKTLITEKNIVLYKHLFLDRTGISEDLFIRNFLHFSNDAVDLMAKY